RCSRHGGFCRRGNRAPGESDPARRPAWRQQFRFALGSRRVDCHASRLSCRGGIFSTQRRSTVLEGIVDIAGGGETTGARVDCPSGGGGEAFPDRFDGGGQGTDFRSACIVSSL